MLKPIEWPVCLTHSDAFVGYNPFNDPGNDGQAFPHDPLPADWQYRDFRPMPEADWQALLDRLTEANYRIVVGTRQVDPEGKVWCRAQMFLSPDGVHRLS